MGMGASLVMIAAGGIVAFAVHTTASGFSIHTVGIILLVVGIIGAVMPVIVWSSWGGFSNGRGGSTTTIVERWARPSSRQRGVRGAPLCADQPSRAAARRPD